MLVAPARVVTQTPVPVQPPPLQPAKEEPDPGVASNVTGVPLRKVETQMAPQAIPLGVLVTVPLPLPSRATVSVVDCTAKFAVSVVAAASVTTQAPVPEHPAPLQPVKTEPEPATAVRVVAVPLG